MPVMVRKMRNKFRVVEDNRRIAKNKQGTALDGGGHDTIDKAQKQARAINANLNEGTFE